MNIPVPTLSFGTIRRLSLLITFIAIDRVIRFHFAALVRTVIVAAHVAIRVDLAVEIGSMTDRHGRVLTAANI